MHDTGQRRTSMCLGAWKRQQQRHLVAELDRILGRCAVRDVARMSDTAKKAGPTTWTRCTDPIWQAIAPVRESERGAVACSCTGWWIVTCAGGRDSEAIVVVVVILGGGGTYQ
jgi:hypothetical protein